MLYHGKISTCNPLTMTDGGVIYETRLRDACKPMALRTPGEVVVWMSEDVRKQFPSGDDIEDAEVTIHVKEWGVGKNGIIKLKGQVVPGIVQPAQFTGDSALPRPQAGAPSRAAASAAVK